MRLTAAMLAATMLSLALPASAADLRGGPGWRHHGAHHGHHHGRHHRYRAVTEEVIDVVEYREPYLPRGVLYNAPPLPLAHAYHRGHGAVISAGY